MHDIKPGDFLVETLVTDSVGYFVTKTSAKSIWVVPAHRTAITKGESNGSPYPVVLTAIEAPVDTADERRLGIRKGGLFKTASWARPLRPAPTADFGDEGVRPYVRTDYSY